MVLTGQNCDLTLKFCNRASAMLRFNIAIVFLLAKGVAAADAGLAWDLFANITP